MNEQMMKQAEEFMSAAQNVRIPENMQAMAEEGVARSREAYQKFATVAKDANGMMESIAGLTTKGVREIGDQAFANMSANTEACFDAAEAVAKARSLPEAAKLQADFVQQQMTAAGEQTRQLLELSTKVVRETAEHMNAVTAQAIEKVKA